MVIVQKPAVMQENIVDNHLWLLNTILGETLQEIAKFLKNRDIEFGYLRDFLINPQAYPGNKITGLRLISEKFLQDIVSKHYFEIQSEGLPVKFVYHSLIKALFQKGMEFNKTSHITMATRGGDDARKAVSTSRIDEPPRLLALKKMDHKVRAKTKSKTKSNLITKKIKKRIDPSKKGKRGFCNYCGARAKPRTTGNKVHINITQNPPRHHFCSKECKIEWIFSLNEKKNQG